MIPTGTVPTASSHSEDLEPVSRGGDTPALQVPKKRLPLVTSRRRLLLDQAARVFVGAGGLAIIGSILTILAFIVIEVLPLAKPARVTLLPTRVELPEPATALLVDEHQTHVAVVGSSGRLEVYTIADGKRVLERSWRQWLQESAQSLPSERSGPKGEPSAVQVPPESAAFAVATTDGWLLLQRMNWEVTFDGSGKRQVTPQLPPVLSLQMDPAGRPLKAFAVDAFAAGVLGAVAQLEDGAIALLRIEVRENAFTGEVEKSEFRTMLEPVPPLRALALEVEKGNLFGGTQSGDLYWWTQGEEGWGQREVHPLGPSGISALSLLVGRRSLLVGQQNGTISVWFPTAQDPSNSQVTKLSRIRTFPGFGQEIVAFAPGWRNRTFLALEKGGHLSLYFSTSERLLARLASGLPSVEAAFLAPKGDGAAVSGGNRVAFFAVENPHPEASWKAFFGKVWFECYQEPAFVWQSTGGTDDFEAKLSLTPLIVGTLKGTFYSLLVAIPLGVLGAMFASQFLHPQLLGLLKPVVEVMASLPSVVLGFLAGIWLAPLLERTFVGLLLALMVLPLVFWVSGLVWARLPLKWRGKYPEGSEIALYVLVAAAALYACFTLSSSVESLFFGGSFPNWLLKTTGLVYDQRNAVVVGLAMGFAVIPIIFAISEDAFSNVPKTLIAGSLALGANRWQTVTRVVLPTASPGVFSAIMVGFGRAVGETMIVLMATGNTPILDFHPFNGFRTLAANIAVEIPEAPHGGTLYRTLFLAALLLFILTFIVNTAAEIVRQNLRRRYSQL